MGAIFAMIGLFTAFSFPKARRKSETMLHGTNSKTV